MTDLLETPALLSKVLLRFLRAWTCQAQRRRHSRAVGEALAAVRAAALARPLPAERLAGAACAALAVGADPLGVVRAAMTGAAMSNPDDPDDFGHRELAYATVAQAVYGGAGAGCDGERTVGTRDLEAAPPRDLT